MPKSENNPYTDPQEMAKALGFDLELATVIWTSWNYQPPTDIEEARKYNNRSTRYESAMRGLNYDRSVSHLSDTEYEQREKDIRQEIYGST